jgi:aspartyl aminopeptidase
MEETNNKFEALRKQVQYKTRLAWTQQNNDRIMSFADEYKKSLNAGKTERTFIKYTEEVLMSKGFQKLQDQVSEVAPLQDRKLYRSIKGKGIMAFIGGRQAISQGINIVASHVDSPRLDIKQNPLYEDSGFAFLDTHYYGGIKTYQWLNIPLAIHGEIIRKDGSRLSISIGESSYDPIFAISDILPHLARDYKSKPVGEVFKNEALDLMIGSLPIEFNEDEKDAIKLNMLQILNHKYGLIEEDFLSAELEIVPRGEALDMGLDRSMIHGYGQDDRICSFSALRALVDMRETPDLCSMVILLDKEEIGSEGNTGAKTHAIEEFVEDLIQLSGEKVSVNKVFGKSSVLSGDVSAALDPHFKDCFEEKNTARFHRGVVINKYTGSGGKGGSSDASAEFMGRVRQLFAQHQIVWQTSELGKVDVGGGGTVAKYFGERGMEVVDCGPALLSMHAPYEISSKADLYETYRAYHAFLQSFK